MEITFAARPDAVQLIGSSPAAARSLEAVAREWWSARKASERWDEDYAAQVLRQLERDVFAIKLTRGLPPDARRAQPLLDSPVGSIGGRANCGYHPPALNHPPVAKNISV